MKKATFLLLVLTVIHDPSLRLAHAWSHLDVEDWEKCIERRSDGQICVPKHHPQLCPHDSWEDMKLVDDLCHCDDWECFVCPIPSAKNNGVWLCNEYETPSSYCYLKCDPGYAALFTSTSCISGNWTDLDKMECEQSVFLLIGGQHEYDVVNITSEIFHNMDNVTCTNHIEQYRNAYWESYTFTTFVYNGLLYICGMNLHNLSVWVYGCASLNITDQSGQWKNHFFSDDLNWHHVPVIIRDKLYFLDRIPTDYTVWTTLPLENEPKLNRIHNLLCLDLYIGRYIIQTTGDSFIVIGDENIYSYNKAVINNNEITAIITEYPRPKEFFRMPDIECVVAEEDGKQWLVLAGGNDTQTIAERLEIKDGLPDDGTHWESLGQLNVQRYDFRMGVTENGIFAMGGYTADVEMRGMVEMFDWESKEWKIIEKKLNADRSSFGKVEIPASIFNCEKNK